MGLLYSMLYSLFCYIACYMETFIRKQKGVIRQRQGVILVVVYSKRWHTRGNLIPGQFPADLDELAAMDRRHQHHQHIGNGFVLVLPGSSLLGNAT